MAYRKIDPRLWDDERFVELTAIEKLLWLYLLTGPHTTSLPGLWIVGTGELVDGLRVPAKSIHEGLRKLQRMGRLVYNDRLRLVRIPNAPRYNRPDNSRALKAWFKLWTDIPECQQKYDHLESLRSTMSNPDPAEPEEDGQDQPAKKQALVAMWRVTFGAIVTPKPYQAKPRGGPPRVRGDAANQSGAEPGSDPVDAPNSSRTIRELAPDCSLAPAPDLDRDPSPESESGGVPETARASARDDGPVIGPEATAVLAKLREWPALGGVATERGAEGLAAPICAGKATLPEALRAIDAAGAKETAERAADPRAARAPRELGSYIAGCIGREAQRRGGANGRAAEVQQGGWSYEDASRSSPKIAEGDEV